jgi:hypothetical protein
MKFIFFFKNFFRALMTSCHKYLLFADALPSASDRSGACPNCYPQVPKRPFFILFPALVLAIVRYLVMVLVNLSKKNLVNAGNLSRKTANIVMSESVQLSRSL